jgi:hypothetical protein
MKHENHKKHIMKGVESKPLLRSHISESRKGSTREEMHGGYQNKSYNKIGGSP